jgi:hypothetical protein
MRSSRLSGLIPAIFPDCLRTWDRRYHCRDDIDVPILLVFGDLLDNPTGLPGFSWRNAFNNCFYPEHMLRDLNGAVRHIRRVC